MTLGLLIIQHSRAQGTCRTNVFSRPKDSAKNNLLSHLRISQTYFTQISSYSRQSILGNLFLLSHWVLLYDTLTFHTAVSLTTVLVITWWWHVKSQYSNRVCGAITLDQECLPLFCLNQIICSGGWLATRTMDLPRCQFLNLKPRCDPLSRMEWTHK